MEIKAPHSLNFMPPFAQAAAWMCAALDDVIRGRYFRVAGLPAPLPADALDACTDAELEAFYRQFGLADYYPDVPRDRRVAMLAAQARLWRALGTPDAVRELCRYVLADGECEVGIKDCLAFDASGNLVHPELLHIFDVEIDPSALAISARDHDRIIDNILKFSPNTETPRIVYYNFGGEALQHIRMAYAGELATEYVLAGLCERIPGIPVGGTIDATSQTMVSIERAGGISNRSGFTQRTSIRM